MLVAMQVAGHGAVVHLVSHAVVGLVVAHAALIVLQTVRLRDKPGDGGELHGTSHTPDLHRDTINHTSQMLLVNLCYGLHMCSLHIAWKQSTEFSVSDNN